MHALPAKETNVTIPITMPANPTKDCNLCVYVCVCMYVCVCVYFHDSMSVFVCVNVDACLSMNKRCLCV